MLDNSLGCPSTAELRQINPSWIDLSACKPPGLSAPAPRKSWESYSAPPLHELNLSDATRVFQLNAPVVL